MEDLFLICSYLCYLPTLSQIIETPELETKLYANGNHLIKNSTKDEKVAIV